MPKERKSHKKSDTSDSDSGPEDRGPAPKKKPKLDSNSKGKESGDDLSFEIGRNRMVTLREFKSKWYLDIREFYDKDGELLPGKKGISLTMEQWQKFKSIMGDIDGAIKRNV